MEAYKTEPVCHSAIPLQICARGSAFPERACVLTRLFGQPGLPHQVQGRADSGGGPVSLVPHCAHLSSCLFSVNVFSHLDKEQELCTQHNNVNQRMHEKTVVLQE